MKQKIIGIVAICLLALMMVGTIIFITIQADGTNIINTAATISEDCIPSESISAESTNSEGNQKPIVILEPIVIKRITPSSYEEACELLESTLKRKETVTETYDNMLELGYETNHPAVIMMRFEIDYNDLNIQYYQNKIDEFEEIQKWDKRMEEYPTATTVWKYLTENMGCNNYVAAGIIGNMMAECGGQTLRLNWQSMNSTGHYGLCQWSTGFKKVRGADLQGQLEFMSESFPEQINRWGDICYKDGFTYEDFMAMEDAEEVAYAFCVIYERPGPGSYNQRRANALKALEYFTN